jgi:hypothetical protein
MTDRVALLFGAAVSLRHERVRENQLPGVVDGDSVISPIVKSNYNP